MPDTQKCHIGHHSHFRARRSLGDVTEQPSLAHKPTTHVKFVASMEEPKSALKIHAMSAHPNQPAYPPANILVSLLAVPTHPSVSPPTYHKVCGCQCFKVDASHSVKMQGATVLRDCPRRCHATLNTLSLPVYITVLKYDVVPALLSDQ